MFTYMNGTDQKLFIADSSRIYDATSPLAPANLLLADENGVFIVDDFGNNIGSSSLSPPVVSGLSGGAWSVVQFANNAGTFLRCVNGADTPLVFDGATWATSPAITGVPPSTLAYVWAFKNRLFFIEKNTLNAWYLAVDAIGGAATKFPLGGVFQLGGTLLFGESWSLNENSGLTASCVFVTTEGEVAVYQGSNPASASDWVLSGVYRVGRPLGAKAFHRAGGDLVIATDVGLVPLSQAIQKDAAALALGSVSYPIETAWNAAVKKKTDDWNVEIWPTNQMVIVSLSPNGATKNTQFVANARTGAWCKFTGWDVNCMKVFKTRGFYGTTNGVVAEMEVTGSDMGSPYTGLYIPMFDDLSTPLSLKIAKLARVAVRAPKEPEILISGQFDFSPKVPPAPNASPQASDGVWGAGKWGEFTWGVGQSLNTYQEWQSVGGAGYALAPAVQITSGSITPPNIEILRTDISYQVGGPVS
jgi:hypothetical protein